MLLIGSMANAQTKDSTRYQKDRQRFKNMDSTKKEKLRDKGFTKNLDLSHDQKKRMDSIHAETHKQRDAIEKDNSLTQEQKQEKIKALNKQEKSKMNGVLTPEQKQKAKQTRENRKKKETRDSTNTQ
jgi:hypothetical protein